MANTNRRYLSFDFVKDNIKDPIINFSRGSTKTIIDKNTGLVRTLAVNVPAAFDDACGRQELWKVGSKNLFPYSAAPISKDIPLAAGTYTLSVIGGNFNAWRADHVTLLGTATPVAPITFTIPVSESIFFEKPKSNAAVTVQLELGATATAYEPNPVVIQPGFLIEGQATNLAPYSSNAEQWSGGGTVTPNSDIAPDGTQTADTINFSRANIERYFYLFNSSPTMGSIWIKGTAGETVGFSTGVVTLNGSWQRFYGANIPDGPHTYLTINTYRGSTARTIKVWGAQAEAGSFPSSYIPTNGAAVTRAADVATVNVSKIWNANEGTIICEVDMGQQTGNYQNSYEADYALDSYRQGSGNFFTATVNFGALVGRIRSAQTFIGAVVKAAVNGSPVQSASKTVPAVTQFHLGCDHNRASVLNGTIQRFEYWPKADDDYMLQQSSNLS